MPKLIGAFEPPRNQCNAALARNERVNCLSVGVLRARGSIAWNGNWFRVRNGIKIDVATDKLRQTMFGLRHFIQHGVEDRYGLAITQKLGVQTQALKPG